uniref:Uncharacterized protein n=1 Tax=Anguilla anguilla TaxID=7936 RepID=A0A0E9WS59_ANGAN
MRLFNLSFSLKITPIIIPFSSFQSLNALVVFYALTQKCHVALNISGSKTI